MLLALFALTQVFLALPAGRYADRHGLRRPVGYSVMAAATGTALAVLFPVFPVLCLAPCSPAAPPGAASIALQRHVGRAARRRRPSSSRLFSWLSIGPATSNFLGPLSTAGLLIDHGGYRLAFLLMALLPLLTWCWVRHAPELPPRIAREPSRQAPRLGPVARADDAAPAAGELVPVFVLGRAHLRGAGAGA